MRKPLPGETLRGVYQIIVDVYEQYVPFRALSLRIDGIDIKSSVLQAPLKLFSMNDSSTTQEIIFTVDTHEYANGTHTVGICDHRDNTIVTSSVHFENVISALWYDPVFASSLDVEEAYRRSHIRASVSPAQEWSVELYDSHGNCVKKFRNWGGQIDVQWQGDSDAGQIVDDDQYELIIRAIQSDVSVLAGGIIKHGK